MCRKPAPGSGADCAQLQGPAEEHGVRGPPSSSVASDHQPSEQYLALSDTAQITAKWAYPQGRSTVGHRTDILSLWNTTQKKMGSLFSPAIYLRDAGQLQVHCLLQAIQLFLAINMTWKALVYLVCQKYYINVKIKATLRILAGWLRWLECCPIHQKAAGWIPGQDTNLGCRFNPWTLHVRDATDQCFSLSLSRSLLSLWNP